MLVVVVAVVAEVAVVVVVGGGSAVANRYGCTCMCPQSQAANLTF